MNNLIDITKELALDGGCPVHEDEWPGWPRAGMMAQRALLEVLHGQKWTISGITSSLSSYEHRFGDAFAAYVGRGYGVPCASGSAALTMALQALGIGPGDEVIVPGLTWVACASTVVLLGATPVAVDIDSDTLCLDPLAVEQAITPATKAVLAVHMYASKAPMKVLTRLCAQRNIHLVEDGSQAHGAILEEQKVGQFGTLSVFSFQQSKLLTGGEGGIVLTDNPLMYKKLQCLRADGRVYADAHRAGGYSGLQVQESGILMGRNLCLSEFHAAILLEGLDRLDRENSHRNMMISYLHELLSDLPEVGVIADTPQPGTINTYYKIPLTFSCNLMERLGPERVSELLSAELRLPVSPLDRPLDQNPLYRPDTITLVSRQPNWQARFDPGRFSLPLATYRWKNTVALPHYVLLGGEPEVEAIVLAIRKLYHHAKSLIDTATPLPGSSE